MPSGYERHVEKALSDNAPENNRFQDESQNLCGDIFMARITILVYSIQLVTIRKATLPPHGVCDPREGAASVKLLSQTGLFQITLY